mgnify:CR=1 FL=1
MIVAIDGPSGVGKSTTSRLVARDLNLPHIDTGAMYRALGIAAMREGVSVHHAAALEDLAARTSIEFVPGERPRVVLNGEDVTTLIRTPEVTRASGAIASSPVVRRRLVRMQQQLAEAAERVAISDQLPFVSFQRSMERFDDSDDLVMSGAAQDDRLRNDAAHTARVEIPLEEAEAKVADDGCLFRGRLAPGNRAEVVRRRYQRQKPGHPGPHILSARRWMPHAAAPRRR